MFLHQIMFFLPFTTRLHFYKTFILLHFDYCISLFVYMNKTLIDKISKVYNFSIYMMLGISLHLLDDNQQFNVLKPINLFPFKFRLLYRFSLFSYKILNKTILTNIYQRLKFRSYDRSLRNISVLNIFVCKTSCGYKRLTYFLSKFVNKIVKFSFQLEVKDFKNFILTNLINFYEQFNKLLY